MENETNQPALCRNGCGFYGNPATDGMCSKCFKDSVRRKQSSPAASPSSTSTSSLTANVTGSSSSSSVDGAMAAAAASISTLPTSLPTSASSDESIKTQDRQPSVEPQPGPSDDDNKEKTKTKRNRCFSCRKKVGLTGFECRCGNVFCGLHRYSDKHDCTFDYKAEGRAKITKDNPVILAEKIQKI